MPTDTPKPGSQDALDRGCTCPVMDNGRGMGSGRIGSNGEPLFWRTVGCPLHWGLGPTIDYVKIETPDGED